MSSPTFLEEWSAWIVRTVAKPNMSYKTVLLRDQAIELGYGSFAYMGGGQVLEVNRREGEGYLKVKMKSSELPYPSSIAWSLSGRVV